MKNFLKKEKLKNPFINEQRKGIEKIVIEKLSQLEKGELDNSPHGKVLALLMKEEPTFLKIYEEYKKNSKQ